MIEMGSRFVRDTKYAGQISNNTEAMQALLESMMAQPTALLLVSETDEGVNGMIGMFLFEHPMSGDMVASETFWWVEPESRGGGVRLMRAAEQWARGHGAVRMQMIAPTRNVGEFYKRVGYEEVETTWQRELR